MKKRIWIPIVILVLLAAFELTMEQRYSIDSIDSVEPTDTTDEEILAEMPEIAISEEDHALEAYVLALPQVQEMLARTSVQDGNSALKSETLPLTDAAPLLSDWTQSGWSLSELATICSMVYVTFTEDNGQTRCIYTFSPDGKTPMNKTVGVSPDGHSWHTTFLYENRGGELTKYASRHQWFAWLQYVAGRE